MPPFWVRAGTCSDRAEAPEGAATKAVAARTAAKPQTRSRIGTEPYAPLADGTMVRERP
jgi:hypothetical protein